ncbi:DUF6397 family protein [Streptomyces sp. NPDC020490]|uniref:DUF6397 family protein n=1 Tax=Streptomyces sp. NPDC020490 TaxID=3365078 RepID=UPI00379F411D
MAGDTITAPHPASRTLSRAARDLGLTRGEFDLAVDLGRIRTVPDEGGGGCRVTRAEIDLLCSEQGFPESLRDSVRVVGTREGAAVMEVPATRFTRLARLGLVTPVRFYLNRYRAVVWLYRAAELRQFAAGKDNAHLLSGRTPGELRSRLEAGLALRARDWRGRHLGFLLRRADGPWERAGAVAALLELTQIAEIAEDPYERTHLLRFRPGPPVHGAPGSPAALLAERIMTADDPDEVGRLRGDLTRALAAAREHRPVPRPLPAPVIARSARSHGAPPPTRPERSRGGLLVRLLGRKGRRCEGYKALKSPSCTTDTSSRPFTS